MLFSGSLDSGHTLVVGFVELSEVAINRFAFQEENLSCFKATALPQDSEYQEWEDG